MCLLDLVLVLALPALIDRRALVCLYRLVRLRGVSVRIFLVIAADLSIRMRVVSTQAVRVSLMAMDVNILLAMRKGKDLEKALNIL